MISEDLRQRLLAAALDGHEPAIERVTEVWEASTGSRRGLTDALLELEGDGLVLLDAVRDGDRVDVLAIQAVVTSGRNERPGSGEPATEPSPGVRPTDRNPRAVFVVHGRNERLRAGLFEFLRAIDLRPAEWSELVRDFGSGVPYIGELLDHAFETAQAVVVLMTPDELVELSPELADGASDKGYQARPNVLFEAGMALGRSPNNTVIVEIGTVRPFSDIAGRHVVRLNDGGPRAVAARQDLAERLGIIGCPVQLSGRDWHTAGDLRP